MNLVHVDFRRSVRAALLGGLCILSAAWMAPGATAQDQITIRNPGTGKTTEFEAVVVDWDAERLIYRNNDRQSRVPSGRVVQVAWPRSSQQVTADRQFRKGELPQARQSYANAIEQADRKWVKLALVARQLQCASGIGQQVEALQSFMTLQNQMPANRFFHLIPLAWDKTPPDDRLASEVYRGWMENGTEVQRLIAASWMLNVDAQSAIRTLNDLSNSSDSSVAHLATAQLWRTEWITATPSDVNRWTMAMERMPEDLQAGPRLLIAKARHRLAKSNGTDRGQVQAIVAMLQVPILFPDQYQLAGSALHSAHQALVDAGRSSEASIVRSELEREFRFSRAALTLDSRVEVLDQ